MVPDRTSSRVAITVLAMVALVFASACAHRLAPSLRVSSTSINRSLTPGIERGRAFERHEPPIKTNERVDEGTTSDLRDDASSGMQSLRTRARDVRSPHCGLG